MPYLRNEQILICPSSSNRTNVNAWNYGFVRQTTGYQTSTGAFQHPDGSTISGRTAPVAMSEIHSPSELVLVSDAHNFYTELAFWYRTDSPFSEVGGAYYWVDGRHNGGANLGFIDGHAKWFPSTSPYGPDNPNVGAGPIEYYYIQ
ncbi:MAG: H-X9-DG-CTERM domain-containing protein [Armatimonadota bacterium]|jgi:prepilin-type processing-associated H-X9-DG protein